MMRATSASGASRVELRVHRAARTFLAIVVLDTVVAVVMDIAWQWAVPFVAGWCLSWLTAVAWVNFGEARRDRHT